MAKFDLTYYSGSDSYSDGDIENYILDLVENGKTLDDIPQNEITWPVFYHLTPIRESICNWYPFKKDASVLEIGAGCGAITGVLCQNASKVTSVDLSKRRASINYARNKQYDNLEIIVGNLNDIKFEEKFDYITLIGVLEYAGRYTEGDKPFHTFINNMKKYLKPDGAILIAIENRLGLKYFSGAPEDHTGRLFDGINAYPEYNGVKTFTKSEMTDLLNECGLTYTRFYYPYPDYKLPNEIFTDESVNSNKRPYNAYDVDRYSLFWEADVSNALQREGVLSAFANSFFVEARGDKECDDSVIYAKLNQERKEKFRVGTVILNKDGRKTVEKRAFRQSALEHVKSITENESKEYGRVKVLEGENRGNSIIYPFVTNQTLETKLKNLALSDKKDEFKAEIKRFFDCVFSDSKTCIYSSDEFKSVFGSDELKDKETVCVCPTNIDLTPANVFCDGDAFSITDCEWVFDFAIPTGFIMWRAIRSLYVSVPETGRIVSEKDLYEYLGIEESNIGIFEKWEKHFIEEYVISKGQGIPKKNEYKEIVYGKEEELRTEIERLNLEVAKANKEIERLNQVIDDAHQMMQHYAHLKTFTLLNINNRVNVQYKHGSEEDKAEFKEWFKRMMLGKERDNSYNCLLQMENILYGQQDNQIFAINENIELKGAKRIDFITPGHTLFIAKQLQKILKEHNIESEIHAPEFKDYEPIPYIVLCPQIMPQLPACFISYQLEQTINSRWLTDKYFNILDHSQAVLEYSKVNIEYFGKREELNDKLCYVPIGVSEVENVNRAFLKDQKYDVLFYGDINCERRKRITDELKKHFNIRIEHDLFGEEMLNVIRQSKVVINIHYYENAMLETTRISEILSLGTSIIVSERSTDPEEERRMEDLVDFVDVDDIDSMRERISYWLENEDARTDKIMDNNSRIASGLGDSKKLFESFLQDKDII